MKTQQLIKILNIIVLIFLFSFFFQSTFSLFAERDLGGVYETFEDPKLSIKSWKEGDFQSSKDSYLQANFGFRKPLLRYRYQSMYSFYAMSKMEDFIVGKEGYIFEKPYLDADKGKDFIGEEKIDLMVSKIEAVQQKLKEIGLSFLIVITPSKAHYHKEYLPYPYNNNNNYKTNYKEYIKRFNNKNISLLNINTWFLSLKEQTSFPLFPKTGIHFSSYGAAIASDSMIRHWEQLLGQDIPDFFWTEVEWTDELRDEDSDLEWAMNLMYPIPNHKMPYPLIQTNEINKYKPNILTVGDSYFWRFYRWDLVNKIYKNSQFLYYNQTVYPGENKRETYNLANNLKDLDGICIYINPTQFNNFSWGIIDELHAILYDNIEFSEENIQQVIERIKGTPEWLADIERKAIANNTSLEDMLYLDAIYILKEESKTSKLFF